MLSLVYKIIFFKQDFFIIIVRERLIPENANLSPLHLLILYFLAKKHRDNYIKIISSSFECTLNGSIR